MRVIGVGVDVVVGEFFRIIAPETSHVGDVGKLDARVALSKLTILQLLRVVGCHRSEQQGKSGSNCCLAVDLGKHCARLGKR